MKAFGIDRQPRHPGLVAEDGAAGAGGGGVDGEHGHLSLLGQHGAERVDGGGLAHAGNAGDADAHGLAGAGHQLLKKRPRGLPVIGAARFHDVMARADAARSPLATISAVTAVFCEPPVMRRSLAHRAEKWIQFLRLR